MKCLGITIRLYTILLHNNWISSPELLSGCINRDMNLNNIDISWMPGSQVWEPEHFPLVYGVAMLKKNNGMS